MVTSDDRHGNSSPLTNKVDFSLRRQITKANRLGLIYRIKLFFKSNHEPLAKYRLPVFRDESNRLQLALFL